MIELGRQYLPQLVPGFLYVYYYLGNRENIALLIVQTIFYSVIFAVVARTLFTVFKIISFKIADITVATSVSYLKKSLTKYTNDPQIIEADTSLKETADKKRKEIKIALSSEAEKFTDITELFKAQGDNLLVVVIFVGAILADYFLLDEARSIKFLVAFAVLAAFLWLCSTSEILRSCLMIFKSLRELKTAEKKVNKKK